MSSRSCHPLCSSRHPKNSSPSKMYHHKPRFYCNNTTTIHASHFSSAIVIPLKSPIHDQHSLEVLNAKSVPVSNCRGWCRCIKRQPPDLLRFTSFLVPGSPHCASPFTTDFRHNIPVPLFICINHCNLPRSIHILCAIPYQDTQSPALVQP